MAGGAGAPMAMEANVAVRKRAGGGGNNVMMKKAMAAPA